MVWTCAWMLLGTVGANAATGHSVGTTHSAPWTLETGAPLHSAGHSWSHSAPATTGDDDDDDDTTTTDTTDGTTDGTTTDGKDEGTDCGCATTGPAWWAALLLPGAAVLVGRRRRP